MYKIMSAEDAVELIQDGDTIGLNAFLPLVNPEALHSALGKRIRETGHPNNLELFCSSGFGGWNEKMYADQYIETGAVRSVVAGHFGSMPLITKAVQQGKIEGYNMPLGVMAHMQRAAASRQNRHLSKIGLNLFVDPRVEGPGLNDISKDEWVRVTQVEGETMLSYRTPQFNIAFIRGTSADPNGNISFEKECVTVDALTLAQATKANGGKVIVQVERLSHQFNRPRNVIVPGVLVDVIVVCPGQKQVIDGDYNPSLSGDVHVPPAHMNYWVDQLTLSGKRKNKEKNLSHLIIGARAAQELHCGNVVNIGIGIPENAGPAAAKLGILNNIFLTVEAGGIGGLPAPGIAFGATIGADVVVDMSQQFDYYDGGGLDICLMGGFEVDQAGNVNAHKLPGRIAGIGGFANITQSTRNIVFCVNFSTDGLDVEVKDGALNIKTEGRVRKFVNKVNSVSFSAINAHASHQNVLYITERCVFKLGENGLELCEIVKGVDLQKDILSLLSFPVKVSDTLKVLDISTLPL